MKRRDFIKKLTAITGASFLTGTLIKLGIQRGIKKRDLWQIDPSKCIACGLCQTECVLSISAVKCIHSYAVCGYCDLCSGYLKKGVIKIDTAAEKQLCPTSAIKRTFVEDPYYEYTIDEELCIACGKCVDGCANFGNGSLFLQIKQEICINCSRCSIAVKCPSKAIKKVSRDTPYLLKGDM